MGKAPAFGFSRWILFSTTEKLLVFKAKTLPKMFFFGVGDPKI
jgi:hypothetical protein